MLRRLLNITALLSIIILILTTALGAATRLHPATSKKEISPTTQRQTDFANGQFQIRQSQTTYFPGSIEHSTKTIFKINFWNIIPWTLICPILWLRSTLIRRPKARQQAFQSDTTSTNKSEKPKLES
jgi:hypothetical protein